MSKFIDLNFWLSSLSTYYIMVASHKNILQDIDLAPSSIRAGGVVRYDRATQIQTEVKGGIDEGHWNKGKSSCHWHKRESLK